MLGTILNSFGKNMFTDWTENKGQTQTFYILKKKWLGP